MGRAAGSGLAIGFLAGVAWLARRDLRSRPPPAAREPGPEPDDETLLARVLAAVALPGDVELAVQDGAVVLFGRVPRYLAADLVARVAAVDGVAAVEDRLNPVDRVAPERPPGPPDPPGGDRSG